MSNKYLLGIAAASAALALIVLVVVLVRAGSDGTPAEPETPTATATATGTPPPTDTATPSPQATTPSPSPETPTATATTAPATATPTPPQATGQVLEHGPRGSGMIALTFDMGGRVDPALDIMNWLIANRIHATIFMTGSMAENPNTDAGRQVLALVDAHPDLFDLGNHSYGHPDFRELSPDEMRQELSRTEQAVGKYSVTSMRPWFRPPFGGYNNQVVQTVAAAGYPRVVMWDIDTIDWRPESDGGPTVTEIVDKVVSRAQGGSIVLMHLGGYNTFEALPAMVEGLQAKGLTPVTLDEMFAAN